MFRTMRRFKQQISDAECYRLLREEKRAAFSVNGDDGYPYTIPINFYFNSEDGKIYFHCAREGYKVDALRRSDKVCFTLWDRGFIREGHWELNPSSVVVFGRCHAVGDRALAEKMCRCLAEKYYPPQEDIAAELRSAFDRVQIYAIEIEHMSGKQVNEK